MNTTQSTINFLYYSENHPRDFVDKVWKDDPLLAHIRDKTFRRSFMEFFWCLDMDNKKKLVEWVNLNYSCGFFGNSTFVNEDLLPPIDLYRKYLNIASIRFDKHIDEMRDMYGLFTIKQWNELLNNNL